MEKLREQYEKEVIPALMKKFEYKSVMQVPKLDKIVINIGLGDTKDNPKSLENAMNDLAQITGQRPMITKETVEHNFNCLKEQLTKLFDCEVVNNYDWSKDINFIDFLRDFGKYFKNP